MQPAAPIPPAAPPAPPPYVPPAPPPYIPPVQAPAPDVPQHGEGGLLKSLDWVETGFLILGAFCMFHIIDYYRRKVKEDKANQATLTEVAQRVEKVEMNFDGLYRRLMRRR